MSTEQSQELETQTRPEGPTPNGGAYAIAYWQDMFGNPVTKSEYARFEIVEYDETGNQVFRTYGVKTAQNGVLQSLAAHRDTGNRLNQQGSGRHKQLGRVE